MSANLKRWLLIILCCLSPVALVALLGTTAAVLGWSLTQALGVAGAVLGIIACPLLVLLAFWWWRTEAE